MVKTKPLNIPKIKKALADKFVELINEESSELFPDLAVSYRIYINKDDLEDLQSFETSLVGTISDHGGLITVACEN